MSWCGGGEMSPTPGVEYRVLAIHGYTLCPGSWPPSPGFAPWAILICRSSALTRYSLVTPNRPDATCLTAERRRSPLGSGLNRSGSSPPSPVLDRPPSRLNVVDGDLRGGLRLVDSPDAEQAAQRLQLGRLVVDEGRVLLEDLVPAGA